MIEGVPSVSVVMGSKSDFPLMEGACSVLDKAGVGYDVRIVSVHRAPGLFEKYVREIRDSAVMVVIAGAGGAAHLPGVLASRIEIPVIGVPIGNNDFGGEEALLSILSMPPGIPVGTVGVDKFSTAGRFAAKVMGLGGKEACGVGIIASKDSDDYTRGEKVSEASAMLDKLKVDHVEYIYDGNDHAEFQKWLDSFRKTIKDRSLGVLVVMDMIRGDLQNEVRRAVDIPVVSCPLPYRVYVGVRQSADIMHELNVFQFASDSLAMKPGAMKNAAIYAAQIVGAMSKESVVSESITAYRSEMENEVRGHDEGLRNP